MDLAEKSTTIRLRPPIRLEAILLGLYAIFWLLVGLKSDAWDWLRGDSQALYIYGIWEVVVICFSCYRLKKWIITLRFNKNELAYRKVFSIKARHRKLDGLIFVRKRKKGKILVKTYSSYCDFLGQFYLDEPEDKLLFNTLDESSIELVEDGVK